MKEGIYTLDKHFIISEEDLNKLSNQEIINLLGNTHIVKTKTMMVYNIYYVSGVDAYALLFVNTNDDKNYNIMPVGMENTLFVNYGEYLIQVYREEFEDDVVVGVDDNNQLDCFEWYFVPESEDDLDTLKKEFETKTFVEFKEIYDDMIEMEIWSQQPLPKGRGLSMRN